MGEPKSDEARYAAFLSYSHKDAAAAGRLHRRLEAYRMPRRLVGKPGARGPVPERLWPIFRDREELPAATDLSETVREALARSGALIVLCSPHAAESLWVAEEIKVFRELHPDRPILAAVLEGDPPACFPAALRAFGRDGTWHEPLATDLRPHADGPRLGLLKLVAGITGVGLDDLVQRDASRRIRRVTAVTAVAVVAMLIMTVLTVVALNARAEAERQRAEAEGLIEFMLTDLRARLRGVGSLEIMQAVNDRALSYYGGQRQLDRLSADSLLRRARILHAIGEDDLRAGEVWAALAAFREAQRTTSQQLARNPDDLRFLLDHARSEFWIGRVHELRREWPLAQRQYVRFASATARLRKAAPNNPEHIIEAAWSAVDLGNVQLNGTRDFAAAQRFYQIAIDLFRQAVQIRPHDTEARLALANSYAWLADSYFMRSKWRQSLNARLMQYRIVEHLRRTEPSNLENHFRFAAAQRAVARSQLKVGNRDNARSQLFQAYDSSVRLTRRDPRNIEWLLFRAMVSCDLYYIGLGFPGHVTRDVLRREIRSTARTLEAQNNPRISEISNCVNAMN